MLASGYYDDRQKYDRYFKWMSLIPHKQHNEWRLGHVIQSQWKFDLGRVLFGGIHKNRGSYG